jgi:putative transposase
LADEPRLYHVWFSTNRRKWLLQGDIDAGAMELFERIAEEKGIELRERETMVDHAHLLLRCKPAELAKVVKQLKGVSARRLFQLFPDLKMDARTETFWQRGFGYRELANDADGVAWYIRTQKRRLSTYDR